MSIVVPLHLAALPIREQPSPSPSTVVPEWLALVIGLALGMLLFGAVLLVGRKRKRRQPSAESRTWAEMDRLCEQGWSARLTLYGSGARLPEDAPGIAGVRVKVEWAELREDDAGDQEIAVARLFWSRSVAAALRAMVQDRDVDHQLEEIERAFAGRKPPGSPE
ncbi:MAG: hypothetical protein WB771_00450 [Solirubrobacterales bacterium]